MIMKKYFINIQAYQQINKLDTLLQKTFLDEFQHRTISHENLDVFQQAFDSVCDGYETNGGRATMEFKNEQRYTGNEHQKVVCKGEKVSMYINLTPIKGEVRDLFNSNPEG